LEDCVAHATHPAGETRITGKNQISLPVEGLRTLLTSFPNLQVLPVDLAVATQAATVRAATGLRLLDALVVASAMLAGCEAIISNDEQWKRRVAPHFSEFRWIHLADFA
jgi:predicted nucleic acid-binding protein